MPAAALIGRHPRFAQRGDFTSPHRTTQRTYSVFREVNAAASAALERRGLLHCQPHPWREARKGAR